MPTSWWNRFNQDGFQINTAVAQSAVKLIKFCMNYATPLTGCFAGVLWTVSSLGNSALAQSQIIPDNTLGDESSQVIQNFNGLRIEVIDGGAVRGINLFHSFSEFNVSQGRGAYFFSPNAAIQNILARVTGSNSSRILGVLGTFGNSNPNLFLINPNGIIFGPNSRLDVRGAFVGTTANAIGFGNQGFFSATEPNAPPLLTVNPSAFLFNQLAAKAITNQSVRGLRVPQNQSLLLLGGEVNLDGGVLVAPGGRVELVGVAGTGTVELNGNGNNLSLSVPVDLRLADVSLTNGAGIYVADEGGGNIAIAGRNVNIAGESILSAGIRRGLGSVDAQAGDIVIRSTGTTTIVQGSIIDNTVEGTGQGGSVLISTGSLSVTNGAALFASTDGQGNAGTVDIDARDTVTFDGESNSGYSSAVATRVFPGAVGNGGDINIKARSLFVTNGGLLSASTFGQGNAGSINIAATESVSFEGIGLLSGESSAAGTTVGDGAVGKGGNITISTGSLLVKNGAGLAANTFGQGNAGNVNIWARDAATFDGVGANGLPSAAVSNVEAGAIGNGGNISILAGSLLVTNGAQLVASTAGQGNGGSVRIGTRDTVTFDGVDSYGLPSAAVSGVESGAVGNSGGIKITTSSLFVTNGAQLDASTAGQGNAGSVEVNARDTVIFDGESPYGSSSAAATRVFPGAVGNGGGININTGSLFVTNGALLTASAFGEGNAGNIRIAASEQVSFDGIGIVSGESSAAGTTVGYGGVGKGGDINISTRSLSVTNGAGLAANTFGQGDAGRVNIVASDRVLFDGVGSNGLPSAAVTRVESGAVGQGRGINITTSSLFVTNGAQINASTEGQGNAGDIQINTDSLRVTGGAEVSAITFGEGKGGNLDLNATESVEVIGTSVDGKSSSSLNVSTLGTGDAGNLRIATRRLLIQGGAQVSAGTMDEGKGGNLDVTATESVELIGAIKDEDLRVASGLFVPSVGTGNAGNLRIETGQLIVRDGARVEASTVGDGRGGTLSVNATESVILSGKSADGLTSGLFARTQGVQDAGDLTINTGELRIQNGAEVTVSSVGGSAKAGDLVVTARSIELNNQGKLTSDTESGNGGNILLQVQDLLLMRHNSLISTTAGTAQAGGDGGNITINAPFIVGIPKENSDITANAYTGKGGNIQINATAIFGLEFRPQLTPLSDITASSQFGLQGTVLINTPGVDPSRGLTNLPTDVVDASNQIAQNCPAGGGKVAQNEFIITGRGGLPDNPGEVLSTDAVWTDWRSHLSEEQRNSAHRPKVNSPTSQPPIVEANGWVINDKGEVVLTATAPRVTPHSPTLTPPECHVPQTTNDY